MDLFAGAGQAGQILSESEVAALLRDGLGQLPLEGKRLLVVIPDGTRTCPIDMIFPILHQQLHGHVAKLDYLVALGTHQPMQPAHLARHLGVTEEALATTYKDVTIHQHEWDNPDMLRHIGTIEADEMSELSEGMVTEPAPITLNKRVFDYDQVLILGPTFPHEVVGFSGGWKYFFPGICGSGIIHSFHWLGALHTTMKIIGAKHTPVRRVVDRAATMVDLPVACASLVVNKGQLAGMYIGMPENAWSAAADLSAQLHIEYKNRTYRHVLGVAPEMYEDIWTGGKVMYKLEAIVADGGELIIYAPHITEVSVVHGEELLQIGYHVRDYFAKQMDKFRDTPGGIMAHSTHVRGVGTFENGVEKPRIDVMLATGIPESVCRQISLGYRDPATINIADWQNREDEGYLFVPKAGEILHRLRSA
jgi:lactate racemase